MANSTIPEEKDHLAEYLETSEGKKHLKEFKDKHLDDLEWALKFINDYEKKHAKRSITNVL